VGSSGFPAYSRILLRQLVATLRGSELPPPFTGPSSGCTRSSGTGTGQASTAIHTLSGSLPPTFLLNSRSPLVTATSHSRDWHPFYQRYGANLPSSLAWITPTRLGLLTQGHLCRFSVRNRRMAPRPFSRAPGIGRKGLAPFLSRLRPRLAVTALRRVRRFDAVATALDLPRCVRPWARSGGVQKY
jgi:hypothetical protein